MSTECIAGGIPPGYKKTDVGIVPEGWDLEPLRSDVTLLSGQHVLAQHCNTSGDGVPYLTGPADFPSGKIQQTKFTNRPTTLCKAGDILVTVKGSGSGTLVEADDSYCISRQLMAIRVKEWNAKFLFYSLLYNASKIKTSSTGLIPGLSRFDILDQEIPLPPTLAEQKAIAEAITDTDALIESLEQLIVKKRKIKQGAMQELLTGKRRLPGFEIKRGYKQTEIGMIPEDWNLDCIENLAHITTGGKNTQDRVDDGQYPFFVRSQKIERISSHSYDGEAVLTAGDGVGTGKVFHYIKGKFDAHQRVYLISEFNSQIDGYFFFLYFSNHFYNRIMQMTAKSSVDSVRREMISRMFVPLPSLPEQVAIATILSDVDSEIAALEEKLAKARQIKQGMIQELLTGRIRLV